MADKKPALFVSLVSVCTGKTSLAANPCAPGHTFSTYLLISLAGNSRKAYTQNQLSQE